MSDRWAHLDAAGHSADVYEPSGKQPAFALIFLHGVGLESLRDNAAYTSIFGELGLACVCPYGKICWWSDRPCPRFDSQFTNEQYLVQRLVPWIKDRWNIAPPNIGLFGISMGGQGALRLAFKHPKTFPVVAAISSAIDYHELYGQGTPIDEMYDSKEQCRQDTAPMHIHPSEFPPHIFFCIDPTDQPWQRGNDRLHEKLMALGVPHESDLTTQAGGHSWEYFNHVADRVVRFVHEGLVAQSRRLF